MKTEFLYFPTKNILVCLLAISQVSIEHGTALPEKFNVMRTQIIILDNFHCDFDMQYDQMTNMLVRILKQIEF